MRWSLNYKSGKPVYLQIVDQVRMAVASGALQPGEELTSIRPLAETLRVNRNTIAKAYAELESQGVIETQQGKGSVIRNGQSPLRKDARLKLVTDEIDQAVVQAHHLQVGQDEFLRLAEERYLDFAAQRLRADKDHK